MNVVLIGAGNVATHLGCALKGAGHHIVQVFSKTEKSAKTLAQKLNSSYTTQIYNIKKEQDLYIIAVKDSIISSIATKLKLNNSIVVHTSGTIPLSALKTMSSNYGVLYPLQTFTKNRKLKFKEVPICIEGYNLKVIKVLKKAAKSISGKVYEINTDKRTVLHLAAVFACNFTNHMYTIAEKILEKEKIPCNILNQLIQESAQKAISLGYHNTQTGPAFRNDENIINIHLKHLGNKPELKKLYQLITKSIQLFHSSNTIAQTDQK